MKKKILVCVGTRPNFIKVVRLRRLLTENGFDFVLLHTGQHFDTAMSDVFFEQLNVLRQNRNHKHYANYSKCLKYELVCT